MDSSTEKKTERKKYKSLAVRKLLICATLSTALVSFFATAEGLNMYIFKGNVLFAGVISAAIQGTLYALSITAIPLMKTKKLKGGLFGRIALIVLWIMVLLTSSIFSFVYVSKTAYPDDILRLDAEQGLVLFIQSESYDLYKEASRSEKEYAEQLQNYITTLNGGKDDGFDIAPYLLEEFEKEEEILINYQSGHTSSDIAYIFVTDEIRGNIEQIKTGQYASQVLGAYKNILLQKKDEIVECAERYEKEILRLETMIQTTEERLRDWPKSSHGQNYQTVFDSNVNAKAKREDYESLKKELENFGGVIDSCVRFLTDNFGESSQKKIHDMTIKLNTAINREDIDIDEVLTLSENIYQKLLEGNTPISDRKMKDYPKFKENVHQYKKTVEVKKKLQKELENVGHYQSSTFGKDSNDLNENGETSIELESDSEWISYWSERLYMLQSELEDFRELDGVQIEHNSILEAISIRRRLYLTTLNPFDRAISLCDAYLAKIHPYGVMIMVSLIFAFGMDLFSFAAGLLLYFFSPRKNKHV